MRITYLKLKNFIGIYAGTSRKELEIKFDNNKNDIIMLIGENGSGKTSLLSALTPMRGNNDDRDEIILEGEEGYKEIHIVDKKDKYIIKHFYGKTSTKNKSFISKNGEELNENGGIKTFNAILYNELGVDEDYFKIGRVGSNVTNFIDYKTTDRKKYINKFIPNIDDYFEAFEIVKEKFSDITKDMKRITSTIAKYDNIDNLKNNKIELEKEKNSIDEKIKKLESDNVKKFTLINQYKKLISDLLNCSENECENTEIKINNNLKTYNKRLLELENELNNNYFQRFPKLKDYTNEKIDDTINDDEKNLIIIKNNLDNLNNEKETYYTNISNFKTKKLSYENKLKSFLNEDLDELTDIINSKLEESQELLDKINKYILDKDYIKNSGKDKIIKDNNILDIYFNSIKTIKSNYDLKLMNNSLEELNEDGSLFYSRIDILKENIENLKKEFKEVEENIVSLKSKIHSIENNEKLLDILNKRSNLCTDDNCSFVKNAIDYKNNEYSKLKDIKNEYYNNIKNHAQLEDKIKNLENKLDFYNDIKKNLYTLTSKINNSKLITEKELLNFKKLFSMNISDLQNLLNLDDYINYFNDLEDYEKLKNIINQYTNKKQLALKEKDQINLINEEIKELNNNIKEISSKIINIEPSINEFDKKYNVLDRKIKILKNIKDIYKEKNNIENYINEYSDKIEKVNEYSDNIEKYNENIIDNEKFLVIYKQNLNEIDNKLKNTDYNITFLTEQLNQLKDIENNYDVYKLVKESLDPKSGIPLIFIDNYLKDIAQRTNELLDLAYKGQFKIKFDISATDFYIRVLKSDGTELKDIKDSSQGETSLTNTSLSLTLVEKAIKKYNIIYLDEIDATLSTENRRIFLQLLERQIEKLNIEQVFIISHNNEFYSYPVDLILLKNNDVNKNDKEFMQNKNIIFDINS